jgi:MFS family permease
MVPVGYASMLFAITANSTLQRFTRPDMRGRVMALYTTIFLGSTAIGGPVTGWAAERWGPPAAFVACGSVAVVAGAAALWTRAAARTTDADATTDAEATVDVAASTDAGSGTAAREGTAARSA